MIGLRKRAYKDRDIDQMARDTDSSLKALLSLLPTLELKPQTETDTGFTWGGKPIYMKNFTGVTPGGGGDSDPLLSGVESVLTQVGWCHISVFGTVDHTVRHYPVFGNTALTCKVNDGNLYLVAQGSNVQGVPFDITIFYTRRDA